MYAEFIHLSCYPNKAKEYWNAQVIEVNNDLDHRTGPNLLSIHS